MRFIILLFGIGLAAVGAAPNNPQRIVGGSVTTIEQYPEMASLLFGWWSGLDYRQTCGGAVINSRTVVSAAHCFDAEFPVQWRIRLGSTFANSGGIVYNTGTIILHPSYNERTFDNDVALLRSQTTFVFSNSVRAGSIAGTNYNMADNQVVWATGWGAISQGGPASEQLRHVQVWTINRATCRQRYAAISNLTVTDNMLCSGWLDVGGRDQCQGDSGGPLFHNGVIVGVCSWGEGCAQARYPGVNAFVPRYTAWIQANA